MLSSVALGRAHQHKDNEHVIRLRAAAVPDHDGALGVGGDNEMERVTGADISSSAWARRGASQIARSSSWLASAQAKPCDSAGCAANNAASTIASS